MPPVNVHVLLRLLLEQMQRRRKRRNHLRHTQQKHLSSRMSQLYMMNEMQTAVAFLGHLNLQLCISVATVERSLWTEARTAAWWTLIAKETYNDKQWKRKFRMSRATFHKLCEMLRPDLERRDTAMRKCVPVDQKVAAVLRTLAGTGELDVIADLFGISRASLSIFVKEVCHSIVTRITPQLIQLPSSSEAIEIIERFNNTWGFPNCIGAIDGTHIPIIAPHEYHTDYFNRKCYYSYNCQAMVDDRYCFRDLCVGMPGSVHDARVLAHSDLFKEFEEHNYLTDVSVEVNGTKVPPVILGDPAYPLLSWIVKPYPETTAITQQEKNFNHQLSRNRMVVENSFGRLKGRWRRLLKRIDFYHEDVPELFVACCTLHNLCEMEGDSFDAKWLDKVKERIADMEVPMRALTVAHATRNEDPHAIRNTLKNYYIEE